MYSTAKRKFARLFTLLREGQLVQYARLRLAARMDPHAKPIGNDYVGQKAKIYDASRENAPYWIAENQSLATTLSKLEGIGSIVDAPFGTGRFCPIYEAHGAKVIGVDVSADMIEEARSRYPEAMRKVEIHVGDIRALPIVDSSIDLVVCYRFLQWIVSLAEAERALRELSRVCGKFALLELCVGRHATGHGPKIDPDKTLWNRLNEEELGLWLQGFGLQVMEVTPLYDDDEHPGLSAFLCRKV